MPTPNSHQPWYKHPAASQLFLVGYAHQRGVLHLDLKPGNVVFDETGQPKVIDLGLARLRNAWTRDRPEVFEISGTPGDMPPERASGQQDLLDVPSPVICWTNRTGKYRACSTSG